MRRLTIAVALAFALAVPAAAQTPQVFFQNVDSVAAFDTAVSGSSAASSCMIIKYRGTDAGLPDVAVAAGGDMTLRIAASADTTTGSADDGIFDLSTPAATEDTFGELVTLINTQGSNWVAVLTGCLASDLTNNTLDTQAATDAAVARGVTLRREATVVSATSVYSAQTVLLPTDKASDIRFFLSGGPIGATTGSTRVNPNPFANYQTFVQHIHEKITSSGTVALFEVLGVLRTYSSTGSLSETVRTLFAVTGEASTVEGVRNFHPGPIVTAPGEVVVVRQRTATGLTVQEIGGNGYMVRR